MTSKASSPFEQQGFPDQQSPVKIPTGDVDSFAKKFLHAGNANVCRRAEDLYGRQRGERNQMENSYMNARTKERSETYRRLGKGPEASESPSEKIAKTKKELYLALGIREGSESSDNLSKFKLWLADWLVGDNLQLAEELLKIGIDKVAETLLQTFSSIEAIKEFIMSAGEQMFESVQNLASFKPYEAGKGIGGLGFGVIGSLWKSVGKTAIKETVHLAKKGALDKGVVDFLEWRGQYMVPIDTRPNIMRGKMYEFWNAMDARYLVENPERIKSMMEIVEHFSDYVRKNEAIIATLGPSELHAFRNDFMEVWKWYGKVLDRADQLPRNLQSRVIALKEDVLTPAYYSINPKHRPEVPTPKK